MPVTRDVLEAIHQRRSGPNPGSDLFATVDSFTRTAAEISAGVTPVNFSFAPFNALRYYSGTGDIDSAIAAAVNVSKHITGGAGGRILIPAGSYTSSDSTKWNLSSTYGIIIEGDGSSTGGAGNGTTITYTGTGSTPWITLTGSLGIQIRNLTLKHSSASFTGALIKCGNDGANDCFKCALIDVLMDAGLNTAYHLDLDKTIEFVCDRVYFAGGAVSVKGQAAAGGSYSNSINFRSCTWANAAGVPVNYGGQAWMFDGCTFEGLANHGAGAFQTLSTAPCSGLTFINCWFGDVTVSGGTWISMASGPAFVFIGNYLSGETANTFGITLANVGGAVITGNDFVSLTTAVNLATGVSKALIYQGNNFNSVTTQLSGGSSFGDPVSSVINPNNPMIGASGGLAPFFSATAQGWEYTNNGDLEIWGTKTITAGTGATLTYATEVSGFPGFTTAAWNAQVTMQNPAAGVTAVYCGTPSTTAMNVNALGTAAAVTVSWRVKGK